MESDRSDQSGRPATIKRLRPSGGYRALHSFQVTTVIYDGTVSFCERFVDKHSRLVDQMTQAARSGRQNIAEGSRASATSSQTELRLINVARASLDELLLDYEDYLRQHRHAQWAKDSPEALAVRRIGQQLAKRDSSDPSAPPDQSALYRPWLAHQDAAVVANTLICLIHQANYLLDQQVRALEKEFVTKGGYSEQLAAARLAHRALKDMSDTSAPSAQPAPSDSPPSRPTFALVAKRCREYSAVQCHSKRHSPTSSPACAKAGSPTNRPSPKASNSRSSTADGRR